MVSEKSVEKLINVLVSVDPTMNYSTTEISFLLASLNSTLLDQDVATTQQSLESLANIAYDPIFDFGVPGVLLNTVGFLGLFGNLISIIILSRPQMKSSINCILIGLASFDLILIITSILMFGLPSIYTYTVVTGNTPMFSTYYESIFPYIVGTLVYPVGLIAQTGSVYLTLCVTVERYVAVCHPLKAKSLCTYGRARLYVAAVGLFSFLYNLPRFWEISWKLTEGKDRNITEVQATTLRQNPLYIEVYINWMYMIFMYIIPFGFLALFNILIFKEVRRANSLRAQLTRVQKREIGLAMMLFCVVISFFLCNSLALVVSILELTGKMLHPLTQTSNLLVTLNSSINFIIYCIFGEKFKRMLIKILLNILGKQGFSRDMELMRYPDNSMGLSQINNERSPYNTASTNLFRTKSKNQNLPNSNTAQAQNVSPSESHCKNSATVFHNQGPRLSFTKRSIQKINNDLSGGNNHVHSNSSYRSLSFCDHASSKICDHGSSKICDHTQSKICEHGSSKICEHESCKVWDQGQSNICDYKTSSKFTNEQSEESQMLLYPISENNADITITVMVQTCNQDNVCTDLAKNNKYTNKKWTPVKSTAF